MGCGGSTQVAIENVNQKPIGITILGLSNVGKTSIIEYLVGEYNQNDPPVHTNGVLLRDVSVQNVLYRFYEIGGIGTTQDDIKKCVGKSSAAIYVCEQNCLDLNAQPTKDFFLKTAPIINEHNLPTVVIVNKARAATARAQSIERIAQPYLGSLKKFFISIAKPNEQLQQVFYWLSEQISPASV